MNRFWDKSIARIEGFLQGYAGDTPDKMLFFKGPGYFLISSALCGLVISMAGLKWGLFGGFCGLLVGMGIPAMLLYLSNEQDNGIILKDLKCFHTKFIQLQSVLFLCLEISSQIVS